MINSENVSIFDQEEENKNREYVHHRLAPEETSSHTVVPVVEDGQISMLLNFNLVNELQN